METESGEGSYQRGLSLVSVNFAFFGIFEDLLAQHVVHRRVCQSGVIQHGEGLADGGVFRMAGGDDQRSALGDHGEDFLRGLDGQADATVGARVGFHPAPVHAVGGLELHPKAHRVTCAWAALAAAVCLLAVNAESAMRGRGAGSADRARGGEEDFIALHDVHALGAGAKLHLHGGRIGDGLGRWVKAGREITALFGGAAAHGSGHRDEGDGLEETTWGSGFHAGEEMVSML